MKERKEKGLTKREKRQIEKEAIEECKKNEEEYSIYLYKRIPTYEDEHILKKDMGDILKKERERQGLSAQEVAEIIGINVQTLYKYEKGERAIPDNFKLEFLYFYHISLEYLFGIEDDEKNKYKMYTCSPVKYWNDEELEYHNRELSEFIEFSTYGDRFALEREKELEELQKNKQRKKEYIKQIKKDYKKTKRELQTTNNRLENALEKVEKFKEEKKEANRQKNNYKKKYTYYKEKNKK